MFKKPKYIIGLVIILLAFSYLVWTSFMGSFQFALTPTEFLAKEAQYSKGQVKISGTVLVGSMRASGLEHSFSISDEKGRVDVHYKGIAPNTFREGADVVVSGRFDPATRIFEAAELLAKCASKYEVK